VLAARGRLPSRFAVLMGDHLFEARGLLKLLRARTRDGQSLLAVDPRPTTRAIAAEATARTRCSGIPPRSSAGAGSSCPSATHGLPFQTMRSARRPAQEGVEGGSGSRPERARSCRSRPEKRGADPAAG
jgi:hypothetical protein